MITVFYLIIRAPHTPLFSHKVLQKLPLESSESQLQPHHGAISLSGSTLSDHVYVQMVEAVYFDSLTSQGAFIRLVRSVFLS